MMRKKKKVGFDQAVDCITVREDVNDWRCKRCGQINMRLSDYNEITTCIGCGRLAMLKRR